MIGLAAARDLPSLTIAFAAATAGISAAAVTTAVALPAAGLSPVIAKAWTRAANGVVRLEDERRFAAR